MHPILVYPRLVEQISTGAQWPQQLGSLRTLCLIQGGLWKVPTALDKFDSLTPASGNCLPSRAANIPLALAPISAFAHKATLFDVKGHKLSTPSPQTASEHQVSCWPQQCRQRPRCLTTRTESELISSSQSHIRYTLPLRSAFLSCWEAKACNSVRQSVAWHGIFCGLGFYSTYTICLPLDLSPCADGHGAGAKRRQGKSSNMRRPAS